MRYGHRAKLAAGDGITEMYEKTRAEGFGPEVQRRIMIGTYVLSAGFYDAYYNRARKVRALIKRDFEAVFADGVDAILTPATPSAAFGLGEMANADPIAMYLNDVFTVTVNLAGLPGIAVPVGLDAKGSAFGPAADRAALGRGRSAQSRLCFGTGGGLCGQTAKMVVGAAAMLSTGRFAMRVAFRPDAVFWSGGLYPNGAGFGAGVWVSGLHHLFAKPRSVFGRGWASGRCAHDRVFDRSRRCRD